MFHHSDKSQAVIEVVLQIFDVAGFAFAPAEAAMVEPYGFVAMLCEVVGEVRAMSEV